MKSKTIGLILIFFLAALAAPAWGEVSVTSGKAPHLIMIGDDGLPWTPVRGGAGRQLLNPLGDVQGDGAPSGAVNPATGMPEVVWSRNEDGTFTIAFSRWDGQEWTSPARISSPTGDHLAPRIAHDGNGSRYVTWTTWVDGLSTAAITASTPDGAFVSPKALHEAWVEGRYPYLLTVADSFWAVHEERRGEGRFIVLKNFGLIETGSPDGFHPMGNEIDNPWSVGVVPVDEAPKQRPMGGGVAPPPTLTGPPPVYPPSDPRVYDEAGKVWVDWIRADKALGYAIWNGSELEGPYAQPLPDPSDLPRVRREVRRIVLGVGNGR